MLTRRIFLQGALSLLFLKLDALIRRTATAAATSGFLDLVRGGAPQFLVECQNSEPLMSAGRILAERLYPGDPNLVIHLGNVAPATDKAILCPTLATNADEHGDQIFVRFDKKRIFIGGNSEPALVYATYRFLEVYAGIVDTVTGTPPFAQVVDLKVPVSDYHKTADFAYRSILKDDWALKNGMNMRIDPRGLQTLWPGHSHSSALPASRYYVGSPELYALRKVGNLGVRITKQLCTSNPETVAAIAREIRRETEKNPNIAIVNIGPNDGLGFCECDACVSLDEKGDIGVQDVNRNWDTMFSEEKYRVLSRRIMLFYNAVSRAVSEFNSQLILKGYAYSAYSKPPLDTALTLSSNFLLQVTHSQCHAHAIGDASCPQNRIFMADLTEWKRRTSMLGIYEYYYKEAALGLPWPVVHTIRADIPTYRKAGAILFQSQASEEATASQELHYKLAARMLWDIDTDVDRFVNSYLSRRYGPAAPEMLAIQSVLENAMKSSSYHPFRSERCRYTFLDSYYSSSILDPVNELLRQAERKTAGSPYAEAVVSAKYHMEYASLLSNYYRAIKHGDPADHQAEEIARQIELFIRRHAQRHLLGPDTAYKRAFFDVKETRRSFARNCRVP